MELRGLETVTKTTCFRVTLILAMTLTLASPADSNSSSSQWLAHWSTKDVTSYQAVLEEVKSRVDCVRQCAEFSHCTSAAVDANSGACYLLPGFEPLAFGGETISSSAKVYTATDPICKTSEAPAVANGTVIQWRHTLTSFEASNATCDAKFMNNDVTLRCLANGQWEMSGQCSQYFWDNPDLETQYYVPRAVEVGWSMCATGVPDMAFDRFTLNIYDSTSNRLMMADFRRTYSGATPFTAIDNHVGGKWGPYGKFVYSPPFPFEQGETFHLRVTATSQYLLSMYVDGRFYTSLETPISVTDITKVKFVQKVRLETLDLWCTE